MFKLKLSMIILALGTLQGCNGGGIAIPSFLATAAATVPSTVYPEESLDLWTACGTAPEFGTHDTAAADEAAFLTYYKCMAQTALRERQFSNHNFSPLVVVAQLDQAMDTYESNAQDAEAPCLDSAASEVQAEFSYTPEGADTPVDIDLAFPQFFSCVATNGGWRAFGQNNDNWYIREGHHNYSNAMLSLTTDGAIEGYIAFGNKDSHGDAGAGLTHFKSSLVDSAFELTTTGIGLGFGCGMHARMNQTHMTIKVTLMHTGNAELNCTADYAAADNSKATGLFKDVEFCYDVSTMTALDDNIPCTTAGVSSTNFELDSLTYATIPHEYTPTLFNVDAPGVSSFKVNSKSPL